MKIILWDWNGTLINDAALGCELLNDLFNEKGYPPISLERYREAYRHPIEEMYRFLGIDLERHPFDTFTHAWHTKYVERLHTLSLHHDAVETLKRLQQRGSRQSILSALPSPVLTSSVERHQVGGFFEHVVGLSDNRGDGKVHNGISLIEKLQASSKEVTVIGDSSHDAEVARAIGSRCILVARGCESRSRLKATGYPVIDSFAELI